MQKLSKHFGTRIVRAHRIVERRRTSRDVRHGRRLRYHTASCQERERRAAARKVADWLSGVRRSEELRVTKIKGTNEGERINKGERINEGERINVVCAYSGPLDLSGDYQGV